MFFGYPAQAVVGNWFHETLGTMLDSMHNAVMGETEPEDWPDCIPGPHRDLLRRKTSIRDSLAAYQKAFTKLDDAERALVHRTLSDQNQIEQLLDGRLDCMTIDELPEGIRQPTRTLFEAAFDLLVVLKIRDQHYERIDAAIPDKICPFCGVTGFDAPGGKREDYDHYLPESEYPFAGINLWNLVPMCKKCNGLYKLATDPIWDGDRRRRAVNPYNTQGFELDLTGSVPFAGSKPNLPQWRIEFVPATEEAETWDQIFSLRERLGRDVFDRSYTTWIKDFASWCVTAPRKVESEEDVPSALVGYAGFLSRLGRQDRNFLKLAVCRLHQRLCAAGNAGILKVLFLSVQFYA
jgi:hypothetical protein